MKRGIYILLFSIIISSCSEYQKVLKSDVVADKFKLAEELYEKEKWNKAQRLLEQVLQSYRGKPQAEKISFLNAMCLYNTKEYYRSGYHFKRFADGYPKSEKAEEALFLSGKSYYYTSPVYSKEQKETTEALEKLQLFANAYPNSKYLEETNQLIKELDFKLEKKAYEIAKQYNKIRDYKASIKSFNNFLLDFPGTTLRGDAMYYRFDSAYILATKSVEYLKEKRIKEAIEFYEAFAKAYPESEHIEIATLHKEELQNELNTITAKS